MFPESRLNEVLAPSRKPRDASDHWDNNESIGFPSLEGTLMAISFLTFAVYLVRLVMVSKQYKIRYSTIYFKN